MAENDPEFKDWGTLDIYTREDFLKAVKANYKAGVGFSLTEFIRTLGGDTGNMTERLRLFEILHELVTAQRIKSSPTPLGARYFYTEDSGN